MKKLLAVIGGLGAVVIGLPMVAAWEAHVVNVTAEIENALSVPVESIDFGTVFPQEAFDKTFDVSLSQSFTDTTRLDDVEYFLRQKPKCRLNEVGQRVEPALPEFGQVTEDTDGQHFVCKDAVHYDVLPLLCPYLSKKEVTTDGTAPNGENDGPALTSFHGPITLADWTLNVAKEYDINGRLAKSEGDTSDTWDIDLHVPCFQGQCAQDWASYVHGVNPNADPNAYIQPKDNEHKLFGCDLWLEVYHLSTTTDTTEEDYPKTGNAYIGYEDWGNGDFDYNDFGMNFQAKEKYTKVGNTFYLSENDMTFTAVIYDSGADHLIHIKRPYIGNYHYTVTRGVAAFGGETPAGAYAGSGDLDVVLFDTAKYTWPQKNIGEVVTVTVTPDVLTDNPKVTPTAPRLDLDPFMGNYDPYENPYAGVVGTFHIGDTQTIAAGNHQQNVPAPQIIPDGTLVPFILVVPSNNWKPPFEDTTITSPYNLFKSYYTGGLQTTWNGAFATWFNTVSNPAVGPGGISF